MKKENINEYKEILDDTFKPYHFIEVLCDMGDGGLMNRVYLTNMPNEEIGVIVSHLKKTKDNPTFEDFEEAFNLIWRSLIKITVSDEDTFVLSKLGDTAENRDQDNKNKLRMIELWWTEGREIITVMFLTNAPNQVIKDTIRQVKKNFPNYEISHFESAIKRKNYFIYLVEIPRQDQYEF